MAERLRRSLVLRLAALFTLLTCLLLAGAAATYYASARAAMERHSDQELRDSAAVLRHRLEEDGATPDKELLDIGAHLFLRIVDRQGRILIQSPEADEHLSHAYNGVAPADTILNARSAARGTRLKLLATPFDGGWLLVGRDMAEDDWLLARLRRTAWAMMVLVPLLALGLGYAFARLSLKPVKDLAARTAAIHPDTLATRFDASAYPLEMVPMVASLNEALERLETAFSRLGELNGNLAHDLRTPLHSLRLECEGLLSRPGLSEEVLDQVGSMVETLDHLGAMIEQMLELARLEDPSRSLRKVELDVPRLLEGAASPFGPLAEERQVSLRIEAPEGLQARGEAILLRRALHNLLANAIRHSRSGGTIAIRARRGPSGIDIEVADEGEGIPAELLPRLGQRHQRADASRSHGGAGLGLAIVQEIARIHGGHLHIDSQEGVGTVARVTWPGT